MPLRYTIHEKSAPIWTEHLLLLIERGALPRQLPRNKSGLGDWGSVIGASRKKKLAASHQLDLTRDATLMQGRAVGWDLTSASGRTSGERRLTFRHPRRGQTTAQHPGFLAL